MTSNESPLSNWSLSFRAVETAAKLQPNVSAIYQISFFSLSLARLQLREWDGVIIYDVEKCDTMIVGCKSEMELRSSIGC